MYKAVVNEILMPMSRRAGTAFAAILVAQGIDESTATAIGVGITAAGGVLFDLLLSYRYRKGQS
ncbi:hypothetical protein [Epibacterium ulvae]|uniref:hypothetical protein n=1 Tax=Epibacterium ulvae TaxID=1156985 RepID=UPI000C221274|nr:hypothetical protein [Epibacterium ulvae]